MRVLLRVWQWVTLFLAFGKEMHYFGEEETLSFRRICWQLVLGSLQPYHYMDWIDPFPISILVNRCHNQPGQVLRQFKTCICYLHTAQYPRHGWYALCTVCEVCIVCACTMCTVVAALHMHVLCMCMCLCMSVCYHVVYHVCAELYVHINTLCALNALCGAQGTVGHT